MENHNNFSKEEAIRQIEQVYHAGYDPNSDLSIWEQLEICESLAETGEEYQKNKNLNEGVNVSGNGSYKRKVKYELNWYKSELIHELKLCTSDTPQNEIATLLEEIFKPWPSNKEGYWLWIAQTYTARTLIWVMSATVKKYLRSGIRKTPPAYFVYLLKFRKQRKEFRKTNDTR